MTCHKNDSYDSYYMYVFIKLSMIFIYVKYVKHFMSSCNVVWCNLQEVLDSD